MFPPPGTYARDPRIFRGRACRPSAADAPRRGCVSFRPPQVPGRRDRCPRRAAPGRDHPSPKAPPGSPVPGRPGRRRPKAQKSPGVLPPAPAGPAAAHVCPCSSGQAVPYNQISAAGRSSGAPPTASSSAAETETAADDFFSPPCSTDHPGGAAISFPPPSFRQGGVFSACYCCILLIFSHSHPADPLLSARCCRLLKDSILPAYDIRFFLPLFAAQGRAAGAASGYVSNELLKMYRNSLIFTKNCHLSSNVRVKLYINAHRTFLNLSIVFLPRRGIKFHCNRQITIVHQEMSNKFLWVLLKSKKQISVIRYSHN